MRLPRRIFAGSSVLLVFAAVAALSFAPLVRSRVAAEGARRKLSIEIGAVRPGWFAVRLDGVHVRPEGVPGVDVQLNEVIVRLGASLSVSEVCARGGSIKIVGETGPLSEQLSSWRIQKSGAGGEAGGHTPIRAEAISIRWQTHVAQEKPELEASGVAFARGPAGYQIAVESVSLQHNDVGLDAAAASVDLDRDANLRSARVNTVQVRYELRVDQEPGAPPNPGASDPVPPPLPAAVERRRSSRVPPSAPFIPPVALAAPATPLVPLPDVHALRAHMANAATLLGGRVPEGGSVTIDGLSLQLAVRGDRISLGPGPLTVERHAEQIHLTFATSGDSSLRTAATKLSLDGVLPLGAGDVVLSLSGGPVALPLLGVKGAAVGLADVERATMAGQGRVTIAAAGDSVTFDGDVHVRGLAIRHPKLANDVVRGLDFGISARGLLTDKGELRIDDAEASMGTVKIHAHGRLEQSSEHVAAAVSFEVPASSCQSLLDSAPSALVPTIRGARMGGTFGARGRLAFDTRRIDDLALEYAIDDQCRMLEVPTELSRERFTHEFSHRIYLPDGKLSEETTGPGTANWTDLDRISPYMQVAVLTTEDGAFMHHRGFNHAAIRSSLVANLKSRSFVRGASTITMQLAKNLFLQREKTLSRKLEEMILTDYLEQIFRKDDMMELYLNIIEFGPNVYGVAQAAEHYFGRKPDELNLAECLFLSSIMPSPVRYHRIFEKGQVSDAWMKHIYQLMDIAKKTGKISQAELAQGLTESILFQKPDMPPPPPRPPVTGTHLLGDDEASAGWEQL